MMKKNSYRDFVQGSLVKNSRGNRERKAAIVYKNSKGQDDICYIGYEDGMTLEQLADILLPSTRLANNAEIEKKADSIDKEQDEEHRERIA